MWYSHGTCFDQWNIRRYDTSRCFPGGSAVKNAPINARDTGDVGSIPESGISPGEGNGNPLQYSCLENPMDRGAWQAAAHGVEKSRTQLSVHVQLSTWYKQRIKSARTLGLPYFAPWEWHVRRPELASWRMSIPAEASEISQLSTSWLSPQVWA